MVIPENCFIFISIFIVAIYIVMMIIGYSKGFLYEFVNLLYTVASLALSYFASPVFANLFPIVDVGKIDEKYKALDTLLNLNKTINTVAYFLIIFLLLKLLYIFISLLLKSMNKIPVIGKFNQFLGAIFGFINATLIVLAISMLLSLPVIKNGQQVKDNTILRYINHYSDEALAFVIEKLSTTSLKEDINDFDIDAYREEFKEWIISLNKQ